LARERGVQSRTRMTKQMNRVFGGLCLLTLSALAGCERLTTHENAAQLAEETYDAGDSTGELVSDPSLGLTYELCGVTPWEQDSYEGATLLGFGGVGRLAQCAAICNNLVPDKTSLWNLACYNMCAAGRAMGCYEWLGFCTRGVFWGITGPAVKKATEYCLAAYNVMCPNGI
jgi:hypothetical protein